MSDLAPHREQEEGAEVDNQYRPENRNVKDAKESGKDAVQNARCCIEPEVELGQSADERAEVVLHAASGWEGWFVDGIGIKIVIGHELWGEEQEEDVQQVYRERVSNDVKALGLENAHPEEDKEEGRCDPAGDEMGDGFVQQRLERLHV